MEMPLRHSLAIAKGQVRRFKKAGQTIDALTLASQAKGLSFRGLSRAVGVSASLLGLARNGERSIKRDVADKIQKLTGFAATKANWPGGIVE